MDFHTRQAIAALVQQLTDLQERVRRSERAQATPQLPNSSLTNGAIKAIDSDGTHRGSIGFQDDGTFATTAVNGPPPPAPSVPVVEAGQLSLTIAWDGLFAVGDDGDPATQPLDFDHVQVHLSATSGFTPDASTLRGSLSKPGALVCQPLVDGVTLYAVLVGVNTSGVTGDASAAASGIPEAVVASDILDGIVTTLKLADGAVTNAKIGGAAVDANKLADGSVSAAKVVAGAIGTSQLALGAVDVDRLSDGSVSAAKLAADVATELSTASSNASTAISAAAAAQSAADAAQATADGAIRTYYQSSPPTGENNTTDVGDLWFDTDTNQAYRWNGTDWVLIEDNTIAQALAAAQNAQTTADGKIVSYWQATAPTGAATGDLWYDTANGNRVSWWTGSAWQLVQMGTAAIQVDAITANLISAGAVGTSELAANSVVAGKVAAGTIGANELAANSVVAGKIAAGVVDATALAAQAVTTAKLAALAVTADKIAANTITAGQIAAGAITASAIAAGAIDGKTITGATVITDSATGGVFVYSGTPASGNLVTSIASTGGIDPYGNAYSAGVVTYGPGGNYVRIYTDPTNGAAVAMEPATTPAATTPALQITEWLDTGNGPQPHIVITSPNYNSHGYGQLDLAGTNAGGASGTRAELLADNVFVTGHQAVTLGGAGTANLTVDPTTVTANGDLSVSGNLTLGNVNVTGAWTAYTPTWTASTTNPTLGNGTLVGRYMLIGKTCHVSILLTIGSTTNVGTGIYLFGVPFTSANAGVNYLGTARFSASSVWIGQITLAAGNAVANATFPANSTTTTGVNMTATSPVAPASGNSLTLSLTYQIA